MAADPTRSFRKWRFVRIAVQALSLGLFLCLLWLAAWPLRISGVGLDKLLRFDPLVAVLLPLATRQWLWELLPGMLVLALSLPLGRVFCGWLCPLGSTLDVGRWALLRLRGGKRRGPGLALPDRAWRRIKYLVLVLMLGAALVGVNLFFWGSPFGLATRLYGLIVHPLLLLAGGQGLEVLSPVLAGAGYDGLSYVSLAPRRFAALAFPLLLFGLLFGLELLRPRFWCRYLCPAGALQALLARFAPWRRRVSACAGCGVCVRRCPTGAIAQGGQNGQACAAECTVCLDCLDVCPERGLAFGLRGGTAEQPEGPGGTPLPSRRAFLGAGGAGLVTAGIHYSGLRSLLLPEAEGQLWAEGLIRPPGSLPEPAFLDRCIRCGACMKACPTNGLQPIWLMAGAAGMFSPVLAPRRGPCEPDCNLCGRVCPTGAIAGLVPEQKQWAKIGSAVVLQNQCLAWAEGRSCMVCQETCPYGAVRVLSLPGTTVPVPVVDALRCYGCGYCEHYCPVRVPAIVVRPLNALRLEHGEYRETARAVGLELQPAARKTELLDIPEGDLPPGFSE